MSGPALQQVAKIVDWLLKRDEAEPFYKPVEHRALGLHDYTKVIKQPMDLGTVKTKLNHGEYRRAADAAADIRLIWSNCKLYNHDLPHYVQLADGLSDKFEAKYAKIVDVNKDWEGAGAGADERAPTLEARNRFHANLYRLRSEDVGRVVLRIEQHCPNALQDLRDGEVELNLDLLEPRVFHELDRYVQEQCLPAAAAAGSAAGTHASQGAATGGKPRAKGGGNKKRGGGSGGGGQVDEDYVPPSSKKRRDR